MLATGGALLATTQLAGAAGESPSFTKGGVFRVGVTGGSVQVDPQLAYISTGWWLEYATAAKLYNYPDQNGEAGARLVPEVASRFTVSDHGRTYTFTIRKGFRFSDGTRVTPSSFKYAINRVANRELASPGGSFITDANGANIVGARGVNEGKATDVSGVTVMANRLTIRLTDADPAFITKLAMPFFQATSTKLPLNREVVDITDITTMPSAGPYAFSRNDVGQLTSLRQNPFWKRGPGRARPRNLSGVDVRWSLNEQTAFNQVKTGELDQGPLPAAEVQGVANEYGVNKSRFWTKASNCTGDIFFNNQRDLFRGNRFLRRAVNWALDRTDYTAQVGPYAGRPWTHLIPPGLPGSITAAKRQPYAATANLARARSLAAGHFRDGRITVYYRSSGTIYPAQAQIVKRDLINLGFQEGNITMKPFFGGDIYTAWYRPGHDGDLGVSMGWCPDGVDPVEFFSHLQHPSVSLPSKYVAKLAAASRLNSTARWRALGRLDLEIMRNVAPLAVMRTFNNRYFFSARVDPRSLRYNVVYSDWSIPALALK